jgi:hypothetical protein
MQFGHNTNVTVAGTTFHVQTEDRGTAHALIDTTIYFHGRVLHRRTNNYFDLLPLNSDREQALKQRTDDQHRRIVEELRSGKLKLAVPQDETAHPAMGNSPSPSGNNSLRVELLNAKTWLTGKRALLQIAVRDQASKAVESATVTAKIEGADQPAEFSAKTGSQGDAQLEFDMPRLAGSDAALVIEAFNGSAQGHLRFQLRARPRAPSTN